MSLRNLANKIALIRTRFNSLNNWARVGSAIVLVLKYGSLLAVGTGVGVWVYYSLSDWKESEKLRKVVVQRQAERLTQFNEYHGKYKLTAELTEITELPLETLLEKLQSRELTAKKVLEAFIAKSLEVNAECNCIIEFHPKAMELAEQLDGIETPKGPLHGIPFCVKDDTNVAGMDSTVGCAKNLYKPAQRNATMVQILQDLGGIPFCRTNLPQTCASYSSHNPIFGLTVNPLNKKLSPGGSSAGTGALLGAKGCLFGIGSDSAGSARLPAHFCGISSLKTTKNRISRKGSLWCLDNPSLPPIPCIMAQNASDVAKIMQILFEDNLFNKYDGKVVPIPWNPSLFDSNNGKLRFGYLTSFDNIFPTIGDTANTILKAKDIFEQLGHTIIPFEFPNLEQCMELINDMNFADLGKHFSKKLVYEEISPSIQGIYNFSKIPYWQRRLISSLPNRLRSWFPSFQVEDLCIGLNACKSTDLWDCTAKRRKMIEELLEQMAKLKLDLILCPIFPFPALPVYAINATSITQGVYLCLWNFMDFPAGVVGKVAYESGTNFRISPKSKLNNDSFYKGFVEPNMEKTIGMPIGVQIVGKPYQEEIVLRAMVELENQLLKST